MKYLYPDLCKSVVNSSVSTNLSALSSCSIVGAGGAFLSFWSFLVSSTCFWNSIKVLKAFGALIGICLALNSEYKLNHVVSISKSLVWL